MASIGGTGGKKLNGNILITGGTGTLGHAIVMLAQQNRWPCQFTIYARSELRLARMRAKFSDIRTVIGDVRDIDQLRAAVVGHDGVIHAAAMKRIPECEATPRECFLTNVQGSENVCRACYGNVAWVMGISTDKACQATTTYGASKLMMESIFQRYAAGEGERGTEYHLVRYGNVVASNGSVIPLWRTQYEADKPLTITDVRMTRFWMSPFDAVRAIEESMLMYYPSNIFVPKVASCEMTRLAVHLFPGCKFDEIGLRSNEKLHESLVSVDELSRETTSGFIIGRGDRGRSYISSTATPLRMEDFDRMLREAEKIEQ